MSGTGWLLGLSRLLRLPRGAVGRLSYRAALVAANPCCRALDGLLQCAFPQVPALGGLS
jgi:hypothetical protein